MPIFYFDVREGDTFYEDEEGIEMPDLSAAEHEAAESAASIGRDRLPKRHARDVTVEVRNENKQRVCTVTVAMTMERVHPEPLPRAAAGS
ncbi:DUF6894 family protein [uncultured Enterovirga sp.]|uniref:DUF6894 family protein n=1 Tax=uncultured Enterovirga sp. TaxID=2026352 RepID=UPI0035C99976